MGWWVASYLKMDHGPQLVACWVFWVIFSIVMHELSHGWMAMRCGDRTPVETGHMTWNPLVHMGQMSLLMFAIVGIAWGAMPVNPYNFRGRYDVAKVAVAGPLMNLLLALICLPLAAVWRETQGMGTPENVRVLVALFFGLGAMLNISLMLFNLIPLPPLDGSKILGDFVPSYQRLISHPQAQMVVFVAMILMLNTGGTHVFDVGFKITGIAIDKISDVIHPVLGRGAGTP